MKSSSTRNRKVKYVLYLLPLVAVVSLIVTALVAGNSASIFKQRVQPQVVSGVSIIYNSGYSRHSVFGERSGTLVGRVGNQGDRDRLLSEVPFRDCSTKCSTWQPFASMEKRVSGHLARHGSLPFSLFNSPGRSIAPHIMRAATDNNSRCAVRYTSKPHGNSASNSNEMTESDVICISPETGAFVYSFFDT